MGETPNLLLPYPEPTDPADVPTDMLELATAVDTALVALDARVDTIEPTVPASRVAPGTNGQVLTTVAGAAAWQAPASGYATGELAHAQITAVVTVNVTTEATAITVVTAPAVTFDGATVAIVEFSSPAVFPANTVGAQIFLVLFDGSTALGQLGYVQSPATSFVQAPVMVRRRLTPSAGSHTYSVRSYVSAGSGGVYAGAGGAGALLPAFIRVVRA